MVQNLFQKDPLIVYETNKNVHVTGTKLGCIFDR
jgi:hypothetical protein